MLLYIGGNTDCGLQQRKCLSAMFADIGVKNQTLDYKRALVFQTLYKWNLHPQNSHFDHFLVKKPDFGSNALAILYTPETYALVLYKLPYKICMRFY